MKNLLRIVACTALIAASTSFANDAYPTKPIRIINPYVAGGVFDVQLRILAERLSTDLGQPLIVESKPGGNANIAAEFVARAPSDGYTLLATTTFITSNPALETGLRWSVKDFQPISAFGQTYNLLVVPERLAAKTVKEFVELAKNAKPPMQVASNTGTSMAPAMEALKKSGNIVLEPIYYKGAPPAALDIANGLLSASILPAAVVHPYIASGKIRPLAVFGSGRSAQYPDIPTIAEAGYPEATAITWFGIHAPAGTPPAVIKRLDSAIQQALQQQSVKDRFTSSGGSIVYMNTSDFSNYLKSETRKWEDLSKSSK